MFPQASLRDLFIRVIVIAITSLVITFITKGNNFDLHFKIRKPQPTVQSILIAEYENSSQLQQILSKLLESKTRLILTTQQDIAKESGKIQTYSTSGTDSQLQMILKPDSDGIIRQVLLSKTPTLLQVTANEEKIYTINYRGLENTFPRVTHYEVINEEQKNEFDNKIIILKNTAENKSYTTPVGLLSESELVATVIDNSLAKRFISPHNYLLQIIILSVILIVCMLFLIYLPSTLALLVTFIFGVFYISLSLWFFDNFYMWTPILTPTIQMILTFLLISNYKFVLNEKTKWHLEKESNYFEQVEEMKTNFLSLFSHDLKTPLAKIIGISDQLMSQKHDELVLREIEKINSASRDLEKYIKRILKMSQVQSKNVSLNKSPEDINTLIEKSIQQNQLIATEKKIIFVKNLSPLFMIDIDGPLVQEVIVNFIENAITYSPHGSKITITSEENGEHLKVSVKDQGRGIPKAIQDNIWEKYYRFDDKEKGYGLGLFLSRYVIGLHNGQVFLNSKENQGSEFGFILPLNQG